MHVITFVKMHSALHDHHRNILDIAKYKPSFVPKYRRDRKSFNVMIIQNQMCIRDRSNICHCYFVRTFVCMHKAKNSGKSIPQFKIPCDDIFPGVCKSDISIQYKNALDILKTRQKDTSTEVSFQLTSN